MHRTISFWPWASVALPSICSLTADRRIEILVAYRTPCTREGNILLFVKLEVLES
jgi:hypothetical protein